MQLRHLAIDQSSYSKHGQIEFFLAGVQPHFLTLQELCLGDSGLASDVNDLLEIALCAWLRDLRIPLPKDILFASPRHPRRPPHRLRAPRAVVLVIQQASRHTPLRLVDIEDGSAGSWFYNFSRSAENANKPFPLDEIPTVEAIDFDEDNSPFLLHMNSWALELGVSLHGQEGLRSRNDGRGRAARPDPKMLGVEAKELEELPSDVDPWFVQFYCQEGASARGALSQRYGYGVPRDHW
ncbi:MAG: hypothetical protein M1813_008696 [Trichoglossum hirsutum]|nr:MAG: hypothetical protein M1813_008696 [Trichoglossum hirsutum]